MTNVSGEGKMEGNGDLGMEKWAMEMLMKMEKCE